MGVTLEPSEWEHLVAVSVAEKKEYQLKTQAVTKSSHSAPALAQASTRLLHNVSFVRTIYVLGISSLQSVCGIGAALSRRYYEAEIELQLRKLLKEEEEDVRRRKERPLEYARSVGHLQAGEKHSSDWLGLMSLAGEGSLSSSLRRKIVQGRAKSIASRITTEYTSRDTYEDLVQLVILVCLRKKNWATGGRSPPVAPKVQRAVWNMLLGVLQDGKAGELGRYGFDDEDHEAVEVLRHLAACKLTSWSTLPSEQNVEDAHRARDVTRHQAFASGTYDKHTSLSNGFYDMLSGALEAIPNLVHSAFDEQHLHLLWLPKYMSEDLKQQITVDMAYVADDLSYTLHKFPKNLDVTLPREIQCLVSFLVTGGSKVEEAAVAHLSSATQALSGKEGMLFEMMHTMHPGLKAGELAHPMLPFLLILAHLLPRSASASKMVVSIGLLAALRNVWVKDFAVDPVYGTGRWVLPEKRIPAMRLVTCLVLGGLAAHEELRDEVASQLLVSGEMASWFWDIAAEALHLQLYRDDASSRDAEWAQWCAPVADLVFYVMSRSGKGPAEYDVERRLEDPKSLVWIFQASGDPSIDAKLQDFSLRCLLRLAVQPTVEWQGVLHVLGSCNQDHMDVLERVLTQIVQWSLRKKGGRNTTYVPEDLLNDLLTARRTLFMKNPADRFAMLMSSASRRNSRVSLVFGRSGARDFIAALQSGEFDHWKPDQSTSVWREMTCRDVMATIPK